MKVSEICEAVRSGEITIDNCGHRTQNLEERLLDWYDRNIEYANGKGDGTWSERGGQSVAEVDASMREHFQQILDKEPGEDSPLSFMSLEHYCHVCGKRYKLIHRSDKLELRYLYGEGTIDENSCEFADKESHIYGGELDIKSQLVIANFFVGMEDAPEDEKWGDEWSLNSVSGRANISKWKLENQGVAFGQLTNTTTGIYLHPNKKSVILGSAWLADRRAEELTEDEYDALTEEDWEKLATIDGHIMVGTVDASVWRWEASDKDNLGDAFKKTEDSGRDMVVLDVEKGRWKYTHFYDSFRYSPDTYNTEEGDVWARLELIEN